MTRTITTADLAPLVTRHGADFETGRWTVELGFPASEPVSIDSWQADLLAAIPSAPVPVVSDAAVPSATREDAEALIDDLLTEAGDAAPEVPDTYREGVVAGLRQAVEMARARFTITPRTDR